MKNALFLIIILSLICLSGCEKEKNISREEAIEIVSEYCTNSLITDCSLSEDSENYIIRFTTPFDSYTAVVGTASGEIISISVADDTKEDPTAFNNEDAVLKNESYLTPDNALSVALNDAQPQGSAVIIQNELDEESNSYKIIFRSLNKEYSYEIDAHDGTIISSASYIDS